MPPPIRYTQTKDGASIAFWTVGQGVPLVYMSFAFSHVQLDWQFPEIRRWYEALGRNRMLVHYDQRGQGLSERDVRDHSLSAYVHDLEAVADCLDLETFALFAAGHSGPPAIAYAARHPDRVSHLIMWQSYALGSDWTRSPQVQAIRAIIDRDWNTYTEAAAHTIIGWAEGEAARRYAELVRETITPVWLKSVIPEWDARDVTDLLPQIKAPTLILHRRRAYVLDLDVARQLASRIPDARLVALDGESAEAYLGDWAAAVSAVADFLGEALEPEVGDAPAGDVYVILFTDIAASTARTQELGDAAAQAFVREHNVIVRQALSAHAGAEIKHTGDGIMASFSSATRALECAIAIQRAVDTMSESQLAVHVGLNAGEPVVEESDLFGTAVQLARRICDQGQAHQILVSDVVRQLAAGKGFAFVDRGLTSLKGFSEQVPLYEVRWRDVATE